MSNRRFEMFHYRQALVRMRQGDSDRDIARTPEFDSSGPKSAISGGRL